jgi:hypothetical protein
MIFHLESPTDFVASWPILCVPEGIILYTITKYFGFEPSRIRMLLCISLPGLVLTILWVALFSQEFDEFFLASIVFIPTNILAPLALIYSIARPFVVSDGHSRACSNFTMLLLIIMLVLYLYDQVTVFADPGDS